MGHGKNSRKPWVVKFQGSFKVACPLQRETVFAGAIASGGGIYYCKFTQAPHLCKSSRLKHFPSSSPTWLFLNSGLLSALVFFYPRKKGRTMPVTSPPCCLSLQKRLQIPANSVTQSPLQCLHLGSNSTPFGLASRHLFFLSRFKTWREAQEFF